jgi:hypothetical protein
MRKITFTVEDRVIERAYKVERSESKTLEAAFYDWLILYAYGNVTRGEIEALFRASSTSMPGESSPGPQ